MTDQYFPEFLPQEELEIEAEQIEIHRKYWQQLDALSEEDSSASPPGGPKLSPTKAPPVPQPRKLRLILRSYVLELFDVEAKRYPESVYLELWLNSLGHRIFDVVDERIGHMESLGAHASQDYIRSAIMESVGRATRHRLSELAVKPVPKPQKHKGRVKRLQKETKAVVSVLARSRKPPSERRALVDEFIALVLQETGERITRTDIWRTAGYREATDFERFQRNDRRASKASTATFSRILQMEPAAFVTLLQKQRGKK